MYGNKPSTIARMYGYSRWCVRYQIKKFLNPGFHAGAHGGDKRSIFTPQEQKIVMDAVLAFLKRCPTASLTEVPGAKFCVAFGGVGRSSLASKYISTALQI